MKKLQFNRRGITLVELLIVLAIFGIVTQTIYSIFFVGNKSYNMSKNKGFIQQDVRIAADFINRELRIVKDIAKDQNVLEEKYYSLSVEEGKLVKTMFNGEISEESIPLSGTLKGIKFNYVHGDVKGIVTVIIEAEENGEAYSLKFNVLLENLPRYDNPIDQNIIYYSKYE
jgi:prepilin-type N-terminal cleavage/methylation domain-containing protein